MEETESLNGTGSVIIRSKPAYNSAPGFNMREIPGAEHGFDNRRSVEGMPSFSSGNREEAEGVGVEAVKLGFITEAREDRLSASEGSGGVVVTKLRE